MAENKVYMAVGEEATRGTAESSTVGFVPLAEPVIPAYEPTVDPRNEVRGEDSLVGETEHLLRQRAWTFSIDMPAFTEAGTVASVVGSILKHGFGKVTSAQNGATGQYVHMMYPTADPFATANLGTKALTLNANINEGSVMKNYPYVGGRVNTLTFTQETASSLMIGAEMFGQTQATRTAEIGSPAFAAENLRLDFENCTVYTGTITRTGSAPDYTDITFGSATQICPDNITITFNFNREDNLRLCGQNYADKTRSTGKVQVEVEMTIDREDPAAGFSSVDEYNAWIDDPTSTINIAAIWDTGTQAGTGDNHSLIIDLPQLVRQHTSVPELSLEADPMQTLNFIGEVDLTTTTYQGGVMLKNTAATV
jgi:hypothetical protein